MIFLQSTEIVSTYCSLAPPRSNSPTGSNVPLVFHKICLLDCTTACGSMNANPKLESAVAQMLRCYRMLRSFAVLCVTLHQVVLPGNDDLVPHSENPPCLLCVMAGNSPAVSGIRLPPPWVAGPGRGRRRWGLSKVVTPSMGIIITVHLRMQPDGYGAAIYIL